MVAPVETAADAPEPTGPWRGRTFGPASEEPYRRRTSDRVRVVVAFIVMILLIRHSGDLTEGERNLFEFFNSLPDGLQALFRGLYAVGTLWALGLVFAAALVARRWRLARDLFLAGLLAWGAARLIGELVVSHSGLTDSLHAVVRIGDESPNFPCAYPTSSPSEPRAQAPRCWWSAPSTALCSPTSTPST